MPIHTVSQGECITSIAEQYGLLWTTIWDHPSNAQLKSERKDPNVLYPGDAVFVPDKQLREHDAATDKRHKYVRKGVPAKLRLRLMDADQPRRSVPYRLEIDGKSVSGNTDGDGYLEQPIPPGARTGKLFVGSGTTQDVYDFDFGVLDPIETDDGVRKRLTDLGYEAGEDMSEAVKAFQKKNGLPVNGTLDEATRAKLKEVFGQ